MKEKKSFEKQLADVYVEMNLAKTQEEVEKIKDEFIDGMVNEILDEYYIELKQKYPWFKEEYIFPISAYATKEYMKNEEVIEEIEKGNISIEKIVLMVKEWEKGANWTYLKNKYKIGGKDE